MFIANILWAVAYDTQYAMVDRDDDVKIGIKSTAILFGENDRLIIGILQVAVLALMGAVGWLEWAGLGILLVAVRGGGSVWLAAEAYLQSRPR